MENIKEHIWFMKMALEEAEKAYQLDEVPIGAVVVDPAGRVLNKSHNIKESNKDPIGHAEILCLHEAAKELNNWRLLGCTLYVTLEPCPMCLSACVQSRISKLVFGAYDPKGGALSLGYNLYNDKRLNHRFNVIGGIEHYDCSRVLSAFFRERRGAYNFHK